MNCIVDNRIAGRFNDGGALKRRKRRGWSVRRKRQQPSRQGPCVGGIKGPSFVQRTVTVCTRSQSHHTQCSVQPGGAASAQCKIADQQISPFPHFFYRPSTSSRHLFPPQRHATRKSAARHYPCLRRLPFKLSMLLYKSRVVESVGHRRAPPYTSRDPSERCQCPSLHT